MAEGHPKTPLYSRLIQAGIAELNRSGLQKFSVRKVAEQCGVSCAAPYKHFKNKQGFIAAIISSVSARWHQRQEEIIRRCPGDLRRQIVEICLEYIHFMVENPYFRSIITQQDDAFDREYGPMRRRLSDITAELAARYCDSVSMSQTVRFRKISTLRALVYGASLMFTNGELPFTRENLSVIAVSVDREFDLP